MVEKKSKLIDNLIGNGIVFENDNEISHVEYNLQIYHNSIVSRDHNGISEIPTTKHIIGELQVIDNRFFPITNNRLTLQLDDRRICEFQIKSININSQTYHIVVSGGFIER